MLNAFRDPGGILSSKIPSIPVVVEGDADAGPSAFTLVMAEKIVGDDFVRLKKTLAPAQRIKYLDSLNEARNGILQAIEDARQAKEQRDVRIRAAAACALVALNDIPVKPSHVIKALMDSIRAEENIELQRRSAAALAALVKRFAESGRRGPIDKISANLVKFCCIDTSETPEFHRNRALEEAILSLRKEEDRRDHPDAAKFEKEARRARITRRGSKEALDQLAHVFSRDLLQQVPALRDLMEKALRQIFATETVQLQGKLDDDLGQQAVDGLSTIRTLVPSFDAGLQPFVLGLLPLILRALHCSLSVLRYAAAKCLATICSVFPMEGMTFLVEKILPLVNNPLDLVCRQGGIECIYRKLEIYAASGGGSPEIFSCFVLT
jgi:TATA-binding protein-associated factor